MLVKDIFELMKSHKILAIAIFIIALSFIYNTFFRYEYKIYNMTGSLEYRVKAVRLDRLTGDCRLIIVSPQKRKQNEEKK